MLGCKYGIVFILYFDLFFFLRCLFVGYVYWVWVVSIYDDGMGILGEWGIMVFYISFKNYMKELDFVLWDIWLGYVVREGNRSKFYI